MSLLTADEDVGRTLDAYGHNHARLSDKRRYDPDSLLRVNCNIVSVALPAAR